MTPEKITELIEQAIPLLTSYVVRIVGVLFVFWIATRIARWLERLVVRRLKERDFDPALTGFVGSLVKWLVIIGAALSCLSVFGVETTSFAAVLGAAGLAVGLAFQGTLGNFAAGVMLIVFRPFKVGDVVSAAGQTGKIVDIGLFTTTFDTPDNRRITVPNTEVAGKTIENLTHHDERRVDIDVGVDYGADIDETREVLERALKKVEDRIEAGSHQIFLAGLGASSVDWKVRVWAKTPDYWAVWEQTVRAIKLELDQAKIGIPYPNMEVHLHQDQAA